MRVGMIALFGALLIVPTEHATAAPFPRDFYTFEVDSATFPTLNQAALQFAVEGVITRLTGEPVRLPKQRNAELQQWILAYTTQPGITPEDAPRYRLNMAPADMDALMGANDIRPWPYPRQTLYVLLLWQQAGTLGYMNINAYQAGAADGLIKVAEQYGVPFQWVSVETVPEPLQGKQVMWQAPPPPWRATLNSDAMENATPRNTPITPPPNALGITDTDMRMLAELTEPLLIATLSLGDDHNPAGVQAMLLMDGETIELPPRERTGELIGAETLMDDVGQMMTAAIAKLRARDMRILATTSEHRMVIGGVDSFAKYQQTLRYVAAPQFFIDHSVYEVRGSNLTLNVSMYGEGRAYAEQLEAATPFDFINAPRETTPLSITPPPSTATIGITATALSEPFIPNKPPIVWTLQLP